LVRSYKGAAADIDLAAEVDSQTVCMSEEAIASGSRDVAYLSLRRICLVTAIILLLVVAL